MLCLHNAISYDLLLTFLIIYVYDSVKFVMALINFKNI